MADLTLAEYQGRSRVTAVYPHQGEVFGLAYATLGLVDEVAEVVGVVADTDEENLRWRRPEIAKEIGDVQWYCAQVATEVGTTLELCSEIDAAQTWDELQAGTVASTSEPYGAAMLLVVRAGAVAGLVKRILRDDAGVLQASRSLAISLAMGLVLRELASLASIAGISLAETAQGNLDKLASRADRGVLRGSGGDR